MIKIGTHSGPFHCDDAMAVAIISKFWEGGSEEVKIIRTRESIELALCDYVVDVGGVHNPHDGRFDHHQDRDSSKAAAGLVWDHFSPDLVTSDVAEMVREELVSAVDAADLGKRPSGDVPFFGLSQLVASLNPGWHEQSEPKDFHDAFLGAVDLCGAALDRSIARAEGIILARTLAQAAIESSCGGAMILMDRFAPVMDYLVENAPSALYLIYPGLDRGWRVQGIPTAKGKTDQRLPLPEAWAALRAEELAALTGVADATFCHPGRFICSALSKEGALRLAHLAINAGSIVKGVINV